MWQAPAESGHARLHVRDDRAYACHGARDVQQSRCPGLVGLTCGEGYSGTLCASCADGWYTTNGSCQLCQDELFDWLAAGCLALIAANIALLWVNREQKESGPSAPGSRPGTSSLLLTAAMQTGPVLLTFVQLSGVTTQLRPLKQDPLPEKQILDLAAFNADGLLDLLRLECRLGHRVAINMAAIYRPLALPVLCSMLLMATLAFQKLPTGVSLSLKAVTLLYVGGIASAVELITCRVSDAEGLSLGQDAFLKSMPFLQCSSTEGMLAVLVGKIALLLQACIIPAALALPVIRAARSVAAVETEVLRVSGKAADGSIEIILGMEALFEAQVVTASAPLLQADVSTPHDSAVPPALFASGAGFIGGLSANCDLVDAVCVARSGCLHLTFDLGTVSSKKADAIMRRAGPRCLTLAKIMRERVLLNDLSERSRTVKGAMDLMLKYDSCRSVQFPSALME